MQKNKCFSYCNILINRYVYIGLPLAINFVENQIHPKKFSFENLELFGHLITLSRVNELANNINIFNLKIHYKITFNKKNDKFLFFPTHEDLKKFKF